MGNRGPVPKRSEVLRRRNKPDVEVTKAEGAAEVPIPDPDPAWHPIAAGWYLSLAESGQSRFYEPSDWWTAVYIAEAMSMNVSSGRMSAQMFAAVLSGMTELLTTEGARRRARIELEKAASDVTQDPSVTALDDYRRRLGS